MKGIERIRDAWNRRLDYVPEREDDFLRAARAYIGVVQSPEKAADIAHAIWPWGRDLFKPADDPADTLAMAGAFIAAEIDRRALKAARLKPRKS
jgi:hypothetical protein